MIHKIGLRIQDLVTPGGSVQNGFSLICGGCKNVCLVRVSRGGMTKQEHLPEKLFCPYCGAAGEPKLAPGGVTDTRPFGGD